jgi:hypothetical protein
MARRVSIGTEGSFHYYTNNTFHRITTMKSAISLAILGALARYASAFPAAMMAAANSDPKIMARTKEITAMIEARQAGAGAASAIFEPVPIFNAKAQYVDVSKGSGHEFVPPSGDDLRGPCPGLNASKSCVHAMLSTDIEINSERSGQPQLPAA